MKKREDGLYTKTITINGKRKYFYGKTKHEVEMKVLNYKEDTERSPFFLEVADEWWTDYGDTISQNSYYTARASYRYVTQCLGKKRIKDIKTSDIAKCIDKLSDDGVSRKTLERHLGTVRAVFKFGIRKGYCTVNTARDVTIKGGVPSKTRKTPPNTEIALVKELAYEETFAMMCVWVLYTGLRRGELLALNWQDVDLAERVIHVTKSLTTRGDMKLPKTAASVGVVPIADALIPYIMAMNPKKKGIVFPDGDARWSNKRLDKLHAEFEGRYDMHSTLHNFRHATADMCIEMGLNAVETQTIMRHASADISLDLYASKRSEFKKKTFDKFSKADLQ